MQQTAQRWSVRSANLFVFGDLCLGIVPEVEGGRIRADMSFNGADGSRFKGHCYLLKPWKRGQQNGFAIAWRAQP